MPLRGRRTVGAELNLLRFRDQRIRRQVYRLVQQWAWHIGEPIFNACQQRANTKGVYRLLPNPRLSEEGILASDFHATAAQSANLDGLMLVLHDTTEFSVKFDDPSPVGLLRCLRSGQSDCRRGYRP
jgi:hypothetical protein